jgi:hypothetical protein
MGQPVCRGLRPVSVDEGILEVEDNWVSADPMFQHTSLAWISPRQAIVWARYYQSAGHAKPYLLLIGAFIFVDKQMSFLQICVNIHLVIINSINQNLVIISSFT